MRRSSFGSIQFVDTGRYKIYWQENGRQRSKRVRGTRDDAEMELARARLGLGGGGAPDPTFDAYWKHAVEPSMQGLAEKTAHDYARTWRVELSPRIGSSKVSSLTWRRAEAVLRDVRSTSVQRHAMRLLRKVCNMAVRDGIIDRNPVDRSIGLDPHSKREKTMLDASDVDGFLESVRGIKYEPAILMELGGGMSHEEACAMAWDNVEAASRGGRAYALCRVEAALVTVGGRKVLKGTKNAFRERTCVVGEPFASRLLELSCGSGPVCPSSRARCAQKGGGGGYSASDFASPATMTHNWRRWCEKHGVGYVRFGDMRSVFATWHGEAGSPDSLVSMAMGHSDGTTRGANYQQNTLRGMMLIADFLADYLESASKGGKKW